MTKNGSVQSIFSISGRSGLKNGEITWAKIELKYCTPSLLSRLSNTQDSKSSSSCRMWTLSGAIRAIDVMLITNHCHGPTVFIVNAFIWTVRHCSKQIYSSTVNIANWLNFLVFDISSWERILKRSSNFWIFGVVAVKKLNSMMNICHILYKQSCFESQLAKKRIQ